MSVERPAPQSSYDPACFARLAAVEERHFWFRARNAIIETVLRQAVGNLPSGYRVLEVGCGTGNVLRMMERTCSRGLVVGMDLFGEGLAFARQRTGCRLVQADLHTPPFGRRFDVIGCFDVLEHIEDDGQVLRDLHGLLAPDGVLLLTVPARASLWSYFDEASHHCRRYELPDLEHKLAEAHFQVEYATEFMMVAFPLVWLGRRLAALISGRRAGTGAQAEGMEAGDLSVIPIVNGVLARLISLEAPLIAKRRRLPIGTSLLAVARKIVAD